MLIAVEMMLFVFTVMLTVVAFIAQFGIAAPEVLLRAANHETWSCRKEVSSSPLPGSLDAGAISAMRAIIGAVAYEERCIFWEEDPPARPVVRFPGETGSL